MFLRTAVLNRDVEVIRMLFQVARAQPLRRIPTKRDLANSKALISSLILRSPNVHRQLSPRVFDLHRASLRMKSNFLSPKGRAWRRVRPPLVKPAPVPLIVVARLYRVWSSARGHLGMVQKTSLGPSLQRHGLRIFRWRMGWHIFALGLPFQYLVCACTSS